MLAIRAVGGQVIVGVDRVGQDAYFDPAFPGALYRLLQLKRGYQVCGNQPYLTGSRVDPAILEALKIIGLSNL